MGARKKMKPCFMLLVVLSSVFLRLNFRISIIFLNFFFEKHLFRQFGFRIDWHLTTGCWLEDTRKLVKARLMLIVFLVCLSEIKFFVFSKINWLFWQTISIGLFFSINLSLTTFCWPTRKLLRMLIVMYLFCDIEYFVFPWIFRIPKNLLNFLWQYFWYFVFGSVGSIWINWSLLDHLESNHLLLT